MSALISRDPFAREEIHRERIYIGHGMCRWCGRVNNGTNGRRWLFQYRVESDGGRSNNIEGLFCSIGCMRDFHS